MSADGVSTGFRLRQLPDGRQGVLDLLAFARRVPVIHGLLEVDVTEARQQLTQHPEATVTAFVTTSVALTLSFDHSVVDGAPAARFAATLRELLESGSVIEPNTQAVPDGAS